MTPEYSRRAGLVLASEYWNMDVVTKEDFNKRMKLLDEEFYPLKDAVQQSDSYDDLSQAMRALFDKIEQWDKDREKQIEEAQEMHGRWPEKIEGGRV